MLLRCRKHGCREGLSCHADVPAPRDERFATVTPRLFAAALTDVALTDGDVYGPRLQTVTFGGLKKVTLKRIRRVAHHDKVVVSAFDLFRVVQAHGGVREVLVLRIGVFVITCKRMCVHIQAHVRMLKLLSFRDRMHD